MQVDYKRSGELAYMTAHGEPEELAAFVKAIDPKLANEAAERIIVAAPSNPSSAEILRQIDQAEARFR